MACERTSKRVSRLASKQLRVKGGSKSSRSVAASALRARRKSTTKRGVMKRG